MRRMKVSIGQQIDHQIVFAGSFGVGKTTALRAISDTTVVNTDVKSLELTEAHLAGGKTTTTVGYDYGELRLPDGTAIALIGLPGQERFHAVWDRLLKRDTGVVLWVNTEMDAALGQCQQWLDELEVRKAAGQLCVALTRLPTPAPEAVLSQYRQLVAQYNPYAPVLAADPRKRGHVMQAVTMAVGSPRFEASR